MSTKTTDRDPTFELLREDLAKNEADLAAQQASLAANRHGIDSMQSQMVNLGSQSLQQADLQREAKANEQNYLLYLSKREQERTSSALDKTELRMSPSLFLPRSRCCRRTVHCSSFSSHWA